VLLTITISPFSFVEIHLLHSRLWWPPLLYGFISCVLERLSWAIRRRLHRPEMGPYVHARAGKCYCERKREGRGRARAQRAALGPILAPVSGMTASREPLNPASRSGERRHSHSHSHSHSRPRRPPSRTRNTGQRRHVSLGETESILLSAARFVEGQRGRVEEGPAASWQPPPVIVAGKGSWGSPAKGT